MKEKKCITTDGRDTAIILLFSVLFAVIFAFVKIAGDDIGCYYVKNGTISDFWEKNMDMYNNWASRVLVNFVIFIFANHYPIYWAVCNGISMYVLLTAIRELFIKETHSKDKTMFMVCMVAIFPYEHLSSAGWIATMCTYFWPMAFGLMSLIPIKAIANGEKQKWWKLLFYLCCLIYGANNEQVMVVLLCSYVVAFLWYLATNHKVHSTLLIFLMFSIASAIFIVICPGNANRKIVEIANWFPAFEHMNFLDKIELGYETVAYWLVFGNNLFFEVICLVLMIMVFKKYQNKFVRLISTIPAMITIAFGAFKTIVINIFPQIESLTGEIPYWGLANAENRGGLGPFLEFFVISICLVLFLQNIVLICETREQLLVSLTLVLSGVASRVVIGLSPTIYASGIRTCAVMSFCFIGVVIYLYANNPLFQTEDTSNEKGVIRSVNMLTMLEIIAGFAVVNLAYVVYNTFR